MADGLAEVADLEVVAGYGEDAGFVFGDEGTEAFVVLFAAVGIDDFHKGAVGLAVAEDPFEDAGVEAGVDLDGD